MQTDAADMHLDNLILSSSVFPFSIFFRKSYVNEGRSPTVSNKKLDILITVCYNLITFCIGGTFDG